jgi:hypothetical protein
MVRIGVAIVRRLRRAQAVEAKQMFLEELKKGATTSGAVVEKSGLRARPGPRGFRARVFIGHAQSVSLSERRQTLHPQRTRCARWSGASLRSRAPLPPVRARAHAQRVAPSSSRLGAATDSLSAQKENLAAQVAAREQVRLTPREHPALVAQSLCRPPRTCPRSPVGWSRMQLRGATVRCTSESLIFTDWRALMQARRSPRTSRSRTRRSAGACSPARPSPCRAWTAR